MYVNIKENEKMFFFYILILFYQLIAITELTKIYIKRYNCFKIIFASIIFGEICLCV